MNKEVAQVAAAWWADQLNSVPKMDNGEAMHGIMAQMAASGKPPLSAAQVEEFRHQLENAINAAPVQRVCISVDYGPDMTLRQAGASAGIDLDYRLPWKTTMWIENDVIKVSSGYRAPIEQLYPL
jgi:hypothetical protein